MRKVYELTTEEVKDSYVSMQICLAYPNPDAEFDHWLAEVKAQAVYDWVRLVQGNDSFTMADAHSFIDTMRIAEEDD
jgi:hypothetical protein